MHVREFHPGAGPTVVLLHSFNTAGWIWDRSVPELKDHHLLIPDLPGYGASADRGWDSFSVAADELADVIATRGQDGRAHVVGLSLGASIGLDLAARHPRRVDSLMLVSASLMPQRLRDELPSRVMVALWNSRRFWTGMGRQYGFDPPDVDRFVESGALIERRTAARIVREFRPGADDARLMQVRAPVLATAGSRDSVSVRDASLRRMERTLPDARTAVIPGGGHYWNLEDPARFLALLRPWLRREPTGAHGG